VKGTEDTGFLNCSLDCHIQDGNGIDARTGTLIINCAGKVKGKGKVALCLAKHYATKTYWGSGSTDPLIL
jgi:hypothetical protein